MLNKSVCKKCYVRYKKTLVIPYRNKGYTEHHMPILESELDAHFEERWKDLECRCPYRSREEGLHKDEPEYLVVWEPPPKCPYLLEQIVSEQNFFDWLKARWKLWFKRIRGSSFECGYSRDFGRFW